jgi:hypothetical protein
MTMPEQEPLFPTSETERQAMQEELLDLLEQVSRKEQELKLASTTLRGEIAHARKRALAIEKLLRQSRTPRQQRHRDDG